MRFGLTLPNLGLAGGAARIVELIVAAEAAGWDGAFVWDTFGGPEYDEVFKGDSPRRAPWDPWLVLGAAAAQTRRIRLGTMVTPLSRRRPWIVGAQVATLDQLSDGRVTLSVSLGWVPDAAFAGVHEESARRVRAERLDEALEIMSAMWSNDRVTFDGAHFSVESLPGIGTRQRPRVPIWVVGAWPRTKSMQRALRFDGLIPSIRDREVGWLQPTAAQLAEVAEAVRSRRPDGYDIVVEGNSSRDATKGAATVSPYRDAGATWWLEGVWSFLWAHNRADERMLSRIVAGPPALS